MGHGRRSDQTQVLVEAWVPACAGMARKGNSRIVTMFIEANWVYSLENRGLPFERSARGLVDLGFPPEKRSDGGFIQSCP